MRFEQQIQFSYKGLQFCQPLRGCLQALLLPDEPGLSFFRNANGQIAIQKDAWLAEQAKSIVSDWVQQSGATSLPDADCVRIKGKRDQDESLRHQSL